MKNLFFLAFTFLIFTAKAQTSTYHPFPSGNANWIYQYFGDWGKPESLSEYTLNGDTTIAGLVYRKIWYADICSNCYPYYAGALREDNRMVYFVPDTSVSEYLLYDFNLANGDTVKTPFGEYVCNWGDTIIVVQEDSVECTDGYRKRLRFSSGVQWIEGIGSMNYLLEPYQVLCVSGNPILQCMSEGPKLAYPTDYTACITSVSERKSLPESISVFPNPSNGRFRITGPDLREIHISDLLGNSILNWEASGLEEIEVSGLQSGIYILSIIDSKNRIFKRKIINYE